jgi:putative peptidoglycan lipid II flippase
MAAFALSNLTGLVRLVLVSGAFGTSPPMEAFTAANRPAEALFQLIAGGALGSAFIPTFTGLLAKEQGERAWKLASAIANWVFLILMAASLLAAVFAPQIVRYLLAPGFASDPEQMELTIRLMRLMLPTAVVFGLSGLVMGILNSHQVFLVPALTPSMYNLGIIFGVLVLSRSMGIYGLAAGVLIGAVLHLVLQIPSLLRLKGSYHLELGFDLPEVFHVARLMGPRLLGVAVVQLNFWVNINLASHMPEGSVNGLTYAFTLMLMPQAIIAQSIAIAALPTFSAQVALGKLDEMRSSLATSLRGVLLLSLPASLGLVILREPLVELLFERGVFGEESTRLVAWALLWYGLGLVGHSVVEVMARSFYALHDTRTPVLVGGVAMGLNVIFSFLFSALFSQAGLLPHGGLALANSLATALEMVGLLVLMRSRLDGLQGVHILHGLLGAGVAGLVMAAGLWFWLQAAADLPAWITALGGVVVGGGLYGAAVFALRVDEVRSLAGWVLGRARLVKF